MKIATFNINSIRNRLSRLLAWLASATPDVVCLQELRIRLRARPLAPRNFQCPGEPGREPLDR
jgi:exodeoxyribonuclease-3